MSYLYVVNSHKPTAVHHSANCAFTGPDDKNLLLAKCNQLEFHVLREDGLKLLHTLPIFGRIVGLEPFRSAGATTDSVFVLTDRKKFCVLSYDMETHKIVTRSVGNVKERKGRDAEMGQRAFMDPDHRVVGLQLYDSSIKILPLDKSSMSDSFNINLEENRILDMKFIHGCARPTLCLLYEDNRRTRHVKTIAIDLRDKTALAGPWHRDNVEFTASMLIPVPSPINGVLVVGMNTITYLGTAGNLQTVEIAPSLPTTYGAIDSNGTRYLLGNVKGNLMVVALVVDTNFKVVSITTDILGNTTIAETINYLDNGVAYIGSSLGDSQLIKLLAQPAESNGHVEILDAYLNIGPILDMCVVDNEKNGSQKQIVTCSGYDRMGSLRVIRSGIGIHEQASLDIPGIKGLWSLRTSETAEFDKFLVQSFVGETRILAIEGEEMGEIEIPAMNANVPSLFCGNMLGGLIVQITAASVRLIDCSSFELVFEHFFSKNITVATANLTQIVLALSGGELIYMQLQPTSRTLQLVAQVVLDQDIACLSMKPTVYESSGYSNDSNTTSANENMDVDVNEESNNNTSSNTAAAAAAVNYAEESTLLMVGMWTDNTVRLLALPILQEVTRVHLQTVTQARDVMVIQDSAQQVYIFVGMGDGSLITYTLDIQTTASDDASSSTNTVITGIQFNNRRQGILGTRPITFTRFFSGNNQEICVFASCDRPTVIYIRNHKILFSSLDIARSQDINNMTPFHSEYFPDCLVLTSDTSVMIGTVEDIQKMHVKTIPLEEGPRRIAYHAEERVYAVLTEKTVESHVSNAINTNSSSNNNSNNSGINSMNGECRNRVLFFNESFEQIGCFELDYLEQGCSLSVCHLTDHNSGTNSSNSNSNTKAYFVVGTGQVVAEELEPSRGRILIFDITNSNTANSSSTENDATAMNKKCMMVAEKDTKAAVYSLTSVAGRLAAGIANRVQIYKFHQKEEHILIGNVMISGELQAECSVAEHIMVLSLKSYHNEYLVVGDVHRSISLLKYKPLEASIEEIARDFNSNMMRALEIVPTANSNNSSSSGGSIEDYFIGADDHANIFMVKYRSSNTAAAGAAASTTEEDASKLLVTGEYHLGDYVNVMRQGSIVTQPLTSTTNSSSSSGNNNESNLSAMDVDTTASTASTGNNNKNDNSSMDIFHPQYRSVTGFPLDSSPAQSVLFGTISGMIGSILTLTEASYQFFNVIQNVMKKYYKPVEGLLHEEYRFFQNDYRTGTMKNMIDGDLVESILDLSPAELEKATQDINDQFTGLIQVSGSTMLQHFSNANNSGNSNSNSANSNSSESAAALMTNLATGRVQFSPEEILRRVEDMSRLH